MIDGLSPYPEYSASEVEWLGDVPAHWQVRRAKYVFREVDSRSMTGEETQLSMSQTHGLVESSTIDTWRMRSESYIGGKLCEPNDLVLNRLKAHLGVFAYARLGGVISPDYSVFRPFADVNTRYFEYVLKTSSCVAEIRRFTKGIVEGFWRLYTDDFYNLRLPFPPMQEQTRIVQFLDHADWRMRRYIRAKRQLIALLNEQKQAMIHRAVTRGLDRNVPTKPSGVDWLGDIPQHWEIVPSRALFTHRNEKAGPEDEILTASQSHGIVSRSEFMAREGRRVMQVITGREILKRVERDDFVISMRSFEGGLEWSQINGAISSAYVMLRPSEDVHPPFYAYLLKTRAYISALRRTSDLVRDGQALRYANFRQVPLPRLQIVEQIAIADFLSRAVREVDVAVARIKRELSLFLEYSTRLISDVVTGKLDVRSAAADLPDSAFETEDLLDEGEDPDQVELDAEPEEVDA